MGVQVGFRSRNGNASGKGASKARLLILPHDRAPAPIGMRQEGDPSRFYELWWVAVALCAAAVVVSLGLTPKRQPAKADVTVPAVAAATDSTNSSVA